MKLYLKLTLIAIAIFVAVVVNLIEEQWKKFRLGDDYEGGE